MKHLKVNSNLLKQLSPLIPHDYLLSLTDKYQQLNQPHLPFKTYEQPTNLKLTLKSKKPTSCSKQRPLLRKNPSNHSLKQKNNIKPQLPTKNEQPSQQDHKQIIKDKAVFIKVTELPYLHSSDLLNNLYKKGANFTDHVQTSVPLYNPPLNNIHALTKIKHLHIYYCKIESLRDMGTGWCNLIQLSIYFGNLKDMSGLNAFPSLQYLHCPFNGIETVSDLMFHPTLVSIDLEFNQISEYGEVEHLFTVENLEYVNLLNNPVYQNKEARRKINEKLGRIIETENTRVEDYVNEQKRKGWEMDGMEGIEYCNNLLNQFYQATKTDEVTLEKKYQLLYKNCEPNALNLEEFPSNINLAQSQDSGQQDKHLIMQYIGPEIPENAYFEDIIMNGKWFQQNDEPFCQEKILMTPMTTILDTKSSYVGPVLSKYLTNKLYNKNPKSNPQNSHYSQPSNQSSAIEQIIILPSQNSKINKISPVRKQPPSEQKIDNSLNQIQTPSEFEKTSTSFSTNCSNLNNTSSSFGFKRTRPSLSKSKEKSIGKMSLLAKLTDNIGQTQFLEANHLNNSQKNNTSLIKQSRILLNKTLTKRSIAEDLCPHHDQSKKDIDSHKNQNSKVRSNHLLNKQQTIQ